MGFFGRRRDLDATSPAIPLTPAETAVLVAALNEKDRLTRIHRPDISGGFSHGRYTAASVAQTAGVAAALGHQVVPHLVSDLSMHDYLLADLHQWAPNSSITRQFELLLARMHVLAGMARVKGWRVRWDDCGMRWHPSPPTVPNAQTTLPQIADKPHL